MSAAIAASLICAIFLRFVDASESWYWWVGVSAASAFLITALLRRGNDESANGHRVRSGLDIGTDISTVKGDVEIEDIKAPSARGRIGVGNRIRTFWGDTRIERIELTDDPKNARKSEE